MPDSRLSVGAYGDDVARLHEMLRKHGYDLPASEVTRSFFGAATRQAVQGLQQRSGLTASGALDEDTDAVLAAASPYSAAAAQPRPPAAMSESVVGRSVASTVRLSTTGATPPPTPVGDQYVVQGKVTCSGFPVPGLIVVAVDLDLRGGQVLDLNPPAITDSEGKYLITYSSADFSQAEKDSADLVFFLLAADHTLITPLVAFDGSGNPLASL